MNIREKIKEQYDSLYARKDNIFGAGEPVPIVTRLKEYLSSGTVLDIGGGEGRNALYLAREGFQVTVSDFSKVGLQKIDASAEKENLPVTTLVSDVVDDGIADIYDAFICTFVLHHIETKDAKRIIEEMQTHTQDGGINIIATFSDEGGLYERNQKSGSDRYYPSESCLTQLYVGWDILLLKHTETTTHARDKEGNRMQNTMLVLVARK